MVLLMLYVFYHSRYCRDIFERNYKTTIGVDFEVEKYRILGVPFSMQM